MEQELHALADKAGNIRERLVLGAASEFERARLLRDMQQLCTELRTTAHRAGEFCALVLAAEGDGPTHPGGRAA